MSEKEKKILDTFGKTIPKLSDLEKEKLLAFGEGMAFVTDREKAQPFKGGFDDERIAD
ncbi:MAG: hypothetical protein HFF84_16105 [Oscillibacter sp.]|nr:hypothetical protein [Oscillibacter sp.]